MLNIIFPLFALGLFVDELVEQVLPQRLPPLVQARRVEQLVV